MSMPLRLVLGHKCVQWWEDGGPGLYILGFEGMSLWRYCGGTDGFMRGDEDERVELEN